MPNPSRGRHNPRLRKVATAMLNAMLLDGRVARWSYRFGWQGKFQASHYTLQLAPQKRLAAPLIVAYASDTHAGPTTDPAIFELMFAALKRVKPDVLLLGGDYVCGKATNIDRFAEQLSRCRPALGTYAVLGNHDLWTDDVHIGRRLAEAGVQMLINQQATLPSPYDNVSICGIDDPWTGDADLARALQGAQPIRILLSHSPDGLLQVRPAQFDVCFAGHTHGGQIAFPDGTSIVNAGGPLSRLFNRGLFPIENNGPLIVSRGIGCSTIPIRINSDPELIICTLR